jgi:methionyl-tRNA synthetase
MDSEAPWKLVKSNPRRAETTLYVLVELLRRVSVLLLPFAPVCSARLLDQLGAPPPLRTFASLAGGVRIAPGTAIGTSSSSGAAGGLSPVFPRCDADGVLLPKKKNKEKKNNESKEKKSAAAK